MRLCSIASSSEGNCIYIGTKGHHYLVDAGISRTRIVDGLKTIGVSPGQIEGIFITHEHSDHIKGLNVWQKKTPCPVYATEETLHAMIHKKDPCILPKELMHPVEAGRAFALGNLEIHPFSISHDAANPVGYTFSDATGKIGIATDLGKYTEEIIQCLKGANAVLIEANHDINMVEVGKYPYLLKKRILGDSGHLSNDNAGRLVECLLGESLQYVLLGHLSKENNVKELAYETVCYEVEKSSSPFKDRCVIEVADRVSPSGYYDTEKQREAKEDFASGKAV